MTTNIKVFHQGKYNYIVNGDKLDVYDTWQIDDFMPEGKYIDSIPNMYDDKLNQRAVALHYERL